MDSVVADDVGLAVSGIVLWIHCVACVYDQCLRTLIGHTGGVWSSQMSGNTVVSGSTDRTVKVWNADTGQCVFTLYGHTSTVRCMHLHENRYTAV